MWFWNGSFCSTGLYGNNWQNMNGVWRWDNNAISMLISWYWWLYVGYIYKDIFVNNVHESVRSLCCKYNKNDARGESSLYDTCKFSLNSRLKKKAKWAYKPRFENLSNQRLRKSIKYIGELTPDKINFYRHMTIFRKKRKKKKKSYPTYLLRIV